MDIEENERFSAFFYWLILNGATFPSSSTLPPQKPEKKTLLRENSAPPAQCAKKPHYY